MISGAARTGLLVVLVLGAFVGGYLAGRERGLADGLSMLAAETQGSLAMRVETLARIRTDDVAGAIEGLEQVVDVAAQNLFQRKSWTELAPDVRRSLQLAKAYRERHPSSPPNPSLSALLETVPMPEAQTCSPALRQLLWPSSSPAVDRR